MNQWLIDRWRITREILQHQLLHNYSAAAAAAAEPDAR